MLLNTQFNYLKLLLLDHINSKKVFNNFDLLAFT